MDLHLYDTILHDITRHNILATILLMTIGGYSDNGY
jgi:hypothetical protein